MKSIYLQFGHQSAFQAMVEHMISHYLDVYGIARASTIQQANAILSYGSEVSGDTPLLEVPCIPSDLIPAELDDWQELGAGLRGPGSVQFKENAIICSGDVFAFCAGQLYRAEELEEDLFEPATHAEAKPFLLARYGLENRPLVDEIMLAFFKKLLGEISIPQAKAWVTFDVDSLRKWTWKKNIKHLLLFPVYAIRLQTLRWVRELIQMCKSLAPIKDPYFQVPSIIEKMEGRPGSIFFLGRKYDHKAFRYDIQKTPYAGLPGYCLRSNLQVGMHGSPLSAGSKHDLELEKLVLSEVLESAAKDGETTLFKNIPNSSRQHYLYTLPGATFSFLSQIGIHTDSSMGFNDRPGFRCGTCHPFIWWDIGTMQAIKLKEIPLVLADFQIHNPANFSESESLCIVLDYLEKVKQVGGVYTLLFHNMYFSQADFPGHSAFFEKVLQLCEQKNMEWFTPQSIKK
jgi:hypothetical protein